MIKKYFLATLLLIGTFVTFSNQSYSQERDTLAVIKILNTIPVTPKEWTFDIHIQRSDDFWQKFVNATFEFQLYDYDLEQYQSFNPEDLSFVIDSSDLPAIVNNKRSLRFITDSFYVESKVDTNVFRIWFDGPDSLFNIEDIPKVNGNDETVLLAKVRMIASKDYKLTRSPVLKFSSPVSYYQDVAFKNVKIDTIDNIIYYEHDNISLYNPNSNYIVDYREDPDEPFAFKFRDINATYVGDEKINVNFSTRREIWQAGFKVKRMVLPPFTDRFDNLDFNAEGKLIASYNQSDGQDVYEESLISNYTKVLGDDYAIVDGDVTKRGSIYCYQVSYDDNAEDNQTNWILGTKCITVPNAVISYASAQPNPVVYDTQLEYFVEDEVSMLIKIVDVEGRILKEVNEPHLTKGRHFLHLTFPEFSSEGLYTIMLVARPYENNDPMVKESTALIKLQKIN